MNVEVFIHGVPYGESFYGKDEDRNYFGSFYDQSCSDSVRFFIQTRMSNGKKYCYYNYLMYNNIIGNDGRSGSYFGMSVRFDAYCKDFITLYKILDVAFCACVQNKILNVQNGNYKYAIQSFASSPDLMKNVCDKILQLIQSSFTDNSFCSLNAFNGSSSNLPTGNLYEANPNDVEAAIKQHGKIAISPYYVTRRESLLTQQTESKIQQIRQQYDERLNANTAAQNQELITVRNELSSIKEEKKRLENIVSRKDEEISRNNEFISKLETKIKQIERNQKAAKNIESIKTPVLELAEILRGQTQQLKGNNRQKKAITFKGILPLIQFVLTILMLLILLQKIPLKNDDNKKTEQSTSGTETAYGENTNKDNAEGKITNPFTTDDNEHTADGVNGQEESSTHIIDVALYDAKKGVFLAKNQEYEASVKTNASDDGIIWTIEGGVIKGDNNKRTIKFVPQSSTIMISFYNNKGESDTRTLIVQN